MKCPFKQNTNKNKTLNLMKALELTANLRETRGSGTSSNPENGKPREDNTVASIKTTTNFEQIEMEG